MFLRLGLTAFGGPVAHIAMMEDEAVVRRQWLMRERFLDLLGVPNLLHGPRCGPLADGGVSGDGRRWGRGAPAAWQHLQAVAPATTRYSMRSPMTYGRRILFASNWAEHCGTFCGSTTDIEDYLIDARGPQSSP